MFENFTKHFVVTGNELVEDEKELYKVIPKDLFTLFHLHSGKSFNNGLYRVHSFSSSIRWSLIVAQYFTKYQSKLYPFGFDWMGRQFCMSTTNNKLLLMLDPATGEDFELEQELSSLHGDDFVNDTDNMLASDLFNKVLKYYNLKSIGYNECMGYKVPLFMGGKDIIENYEKYDLQVYWEIQNQLYKKVKGLPDGTNIKSIKIE